jgi:hypothetical protein
LTTFLNGEVVAKLKLITARAYGTAPDSAKQRRAELWNALNRYIMESGGAVTSPAGTSPLRVEVSKTSNLATQLSNAGYQCHQAGRIMRVVGDPKSPFMERDVIEVDLPKVF